MGMFSSELSLKIIEELVKEPACAMDLARRLNQHEQKIYYHLRRLESAGVVKHIRSEKRYSMTAKIYGVVSPVVSTRLFDGGKAMTKPKPMVKESLEKLMDPFIKDGRLNAKIIIGSPYPHGRYEATARFGPHLAGLMMFLGSMLTEQSSNGYVMDTAAREGDLKDNNIIVIGNPKVNTIADRMNEMLPIHFDDKKQFSISSKLSGELYNYDHDAVVMKLPNPFNDKKWMLYLAGKRSMGLKTAILALTKFHDKIMGGNSKDKKVIAKVMSGIDKKGDGDIDSVKFME